MTDTTEKIHTYFIYHKITKEFCGSYETFPILSRFVGFKWFKRYKLNPNDYEVLCDQDDRLIDYLEAKLSY